MAEKNVLADSGLQTFVLQDASGTELARIRFNPGDVGIMTRGADALKTIRAEIEKLNAVPAGDVLDRLNAMRQAERTVCAALDWMLGAPVSKELFAHISPLAVTKSGALWIENIVEALTPEISGALQEGLAANRARAAQRASGGQYADADKLLAQLDRYDAGRGTP